MPHHVVTTWVAPYIHWITFVVLDIDNQDVVDADGSCGGDGTIVIYDTVVLYDSDWM